MSPPNREFGRVSDNRDWVVWNGSIGIVDMAAMGRVEHGENGRSAWLADPYDVVGPFSLDELETFGSITFEACMVMSRAKWQELQVGLRRKAQAERREYAKRFAPVTDDEEDESEHRALLELPEDGPLSAQEINSAFRRLAKKAHPDAGGDHESYIRLTEARDALLEQVSVSY
jgi:hypothetical protein